ncbi:type II secretion system F family protein [Cellulomonas sp. zg-ZUI222]|uniref:Type II secretion system F family protein n=1 Tax=Cellulomonas wangleii TaxID=2816956 RepID=A0ABX8D3Y9_9CELL|nr:type II secretion system F family protein [Cellulomonas wangleii]MBO0919695.1 type II secretion system F family protein [Cellulomonas wangleii]MBO0923878.1 type II secretion system F family protein [Cellulomonas wangleii]MBO0924160.1 type II secretion system F family protein [Cellulomonas wangleii]QVI62182.1 type II secretion system F family protein [Cellulomonas wangleii]
MTPTLLLVVCLGALVGGGVVLLVDSLLPRDRRRATVRSEGPSLVERIGRQGALALGAGLLVLLLTRWPVAAVAAVLLVLVWPVLFGGARAERQAMARIEALAAWTESLRDTIAGAVGLEQAIPATVTAASPVIQPQLRLLVDRLRVRVPLATALQRLADDLDDPSADLIVAALILNARLRGPGLRQVLSSLSDAGRAELDMRQRVGAGRASTRRSALIVTVFSIVAILGLTVLNPTYVEPYGTATGQLVLTLVCTLFAAGFLWMRRLSGVELPERFLVATPDRAAPADRGGAPDGRALTGPEVRG